MSNQNFKNKSKTIKKVSQFCYASVNSNHVGTPEELSTSVFSFRGRPHLHLIPKWRPINYSFVCPFASFSLSFIHFDETKKAN